MRPAIHWRSLGTRFLLWASWVLLVAGCLALGYSAFTTLQGVFYQSTNARSFDHLVSELKRPGIAPPPQLRLMAVEGRPMSRMEIPRLGVSVLIVEGTTAHTL